MLARRLPDGHYTKNRRHYHKAWKELAKPIEVATGAKLVSYGPVLEFATKNYQYTFRLGLYEARKLSAALSQEPKVPSIVAWARSQD